MKTDKKEGNQPVVRRNPDDLGFVSVVTIEKQSTDGSIVVTDVDLRGFKKGLGEAETWSVKLYEYFKENTDKYPNIAEVRVAIACQKDFHEYDIYDFDRLLRDANTVHEKGCL